METADIETAALRAVELGVQGRVDPRLIVATRHRLPGPRKTARLLAGLANAADGRKPLLLVGLHGAEIHGVDEPPSARWWQRVADGFAGPAPDIRWTMVDLDGPQLLAISSDPVDELVTAWRKDRVFVPWFDGRRVVPAPSPTRPEKRGATDALPTVRVVTGWMERTPISGAPQVHAYRGALDIELQPTPGVMADKSCSATLLVPDRSAPISLSAQAHPMTNDVGVVRREHGIEVRTSFTARLYLAAAVADDATPVTPGTAQLVVSLLLPGRSVPELRSLLFSPDPTVDAGRWIL